jgi:hypothetical protein
MRRRTSAICRSRTTQHNTTKGEGGRKGKGTEQEKGGEGAILRGRHSSGSSSSSRPSFDFERIRCLTLGAGGMASKEEGRSRGRGEPRARSTLVRYRFPRLKHKAATSSLASNCVNLRHLHQQLICGAAFYPCHVNISLPFFASCRHGSHTGRRTGGLDGCDTRGGARGAARAQ